MYEDPETFHPERFLRDGKPNPNAPDPDEFSFGFGRRCVFRFVGPTVHTYSEHRLTCLHVDRICPGRHFGLAAVYINVASALHVFKFSPPLDEHGREIKIEPRMVSGFVS